MMRSVHSDFCVDSQHTLVLFRNMIFYDIFIKEMHCEVYQEPDSILSL